MVGLWLEFLEGLVNRSLGRFPEYREQTFHPWKKKYVGMRGTNVSKLRILEEKSSHL
jgi:hypothetical protein